MYILQLINNTCKYIFLIKSQKLHHRKVSSTHNIIICHFHRINNALSNPLRHIREDPQCDGARLLWCAGGGGGASSLNPIFTQFALCQDRIERKPNNSCTSRCGIPGRHYSEVNRSYALTLYVHSIHISDVRNINSADQL